MFPLGVVGVVGQSSARKAALTTLLRSAAEAELDSEDARYKLCTLVSAAMDFAGGSWSWTHYHTLMAAENGWLFFLKGNY